MFTLRSSLAYDFEQLLFRPRYTSEEGNWRINAGIAHSFATNDTSWNAGASFTLN